MYINFVLNVEKKSNFKIIQGKTPDIFLESGENKPLMHAMPEKSTIEVNVKY